MKIASLIPSGTDIAVALGLQDSLVGISHCCDNPQTAQLPVLTRSIIDSNLAPAQIDADVSGAVSSGESLYQTNRKLLCELAPDLVLTQTICDVCAVNSQTARRDLPPNAKLLNLSAVSINGLWEDLRNVARATNTDAEEIIGELQLRLQKMKGAAEGKIKPRVLVLEWSDPPFLGGHWVPEMVEIAGGTHVLSGAMEPSRRAGWDEIRAAKPEIVILAPCGYDLEETIAQSREIEGELASVGAREIWATNATALFSRCTPATIRGVEVLAFIFCRIGEIEGEEAIKIKF
ncbi:iron complex transport system substrate-binding protein [Abditibacterium utsteinense]|uniref:Iron complex transport system substrate-binding protein n=1 Tax=Abditibacterium utsteinense TaxID=1960156 RepID=A0A2S8SQ88_9BACT|nr:ABC transporter substrate-binding protein [Abditibacterium utsteinense]PQV62961.1 iron complex transport system substrate-binding protein [Abditibacterium utsteinense]